MSARVTQDNFRVEGYGTFVPPEGLTPEECERLAREADEARQKENT